MFVGSSRERLGPHSADRLDRDRPCRIQQLVGINVVFYYCTVLWQSVGFSEDDALLTNILSDLVSITACVITSLIVDRIGRHGGDLDADGKCLFGTLEAVDGVRMSPALGRLAFMCALAYSALFNMTWGPVTWVMLGEMFPTQIRGSGLAIAGLSQWTTNFLAAVSFPALAAGGGLAIAYGCYAARAVASLFFVHLTVQETRARELEQMTG